MSGVIRFSVSLEKELLKKFDEALKEEGQPSRSHAIAELIRAYLAGLSWKKGENAVGTILLVYDHHKRELATRLLHVQHEHNSIVLSTQHIHLSREKCLEILAVKGKSKEVENLYRALKNLRGLEFVTIVTVPAE